MTQGLYFEDQKDIANAAGPATAMLDDAEIRYSGEAAGNEHSMDFYLGCGK